MLSRVCPAIAVVAAIALCLPAAAHYERINQPNPNDPMAAHIYRLDNGLTVYLTRNKETLRFYAEIAVRAGSKTDPADATGLAHYLEHLLFKGNQTLGTLDYGKEKAYIDQITGLYDQHFKETDEVKRKALYAEINRVSQEAAQYAVPNEIDKIYKALGGGELNAHTWNEETVYQVALPMNRLRQWAAIESVRFQEPVFRLFHTELETVYEEKNRTLDNKDRVINEAVEALVFKKHPYGQQTTIGTVEHLKNPNLNYIRDYFNTWYVPNNMAICISGNIDIDEAIQVIDENFSAWKSKDLPAPKVFAEDPLQGEERVTVKYKSEEQVVLAFRLPGQNDPDAEALKLIDMIMDNSVAGLINLNLNQAQRVRQAGSYPYQMNDYGVEHLWGVPKDGQSLDEVQQLLLEQIEKVKKGEFEDWVLPAIVTDFKKHQKASLESDVARVNQMTNAFLGFTDWDRKVGEIARIEKLTKDDVVRVANQYFSGGYVSGRRIDEQQEIPSITKPQIDPVKIDPTRQSDFAKKILAISAKPIEPVFVDPEKDYTVAGYKEGVKLYYAPNPLNDLFSLSILVEFGTFEDNKIGVSTLLLDKSGTKRFSAEDLKKEWYKLGMDASVNAGDNETFIAISGLDENFEKSLALLMEWITGPTADAATLDELKQIILVSREDEKKDPGALNRALSAYHRYGAESSFLRRLPSAELQKLTVDELQALIRGLLDYKHVITYTGSLPLDRVQKALAKLHPLPSTLKDPPPYRFLRARAPASNEVFFFNKEAAQAQVRIEYRSGVYGPDILTPAELYNSYFADGMSSIVFQELRESRALAYSAGALYHVGTRIDDENLMIGAIGCQADKTPEAVAAFIEIMDKLPESPERMQEALTALDNQYRTSKLGFRDVIGAVRAWEKLGLAPDPRKKQFEALKSAGLETVLAFHKQWVKDRAKLISVVGDKNRIDMTALKQYGDITEVELDALFVD
jgi:predicted Zn-dependent peptidase